MLKTLLLLCTQLFVESAVAQNIDVALVLAADVSVSMDQDKHLEIQKQGYSTSLIDQAVLQAINHGKHKTIAVTFFVWAAPYNQRVVVPWTLIRNAEDAGAFAAQVDAFDHAHSSAYSRGSTAVGDALTYADKLMEAMPFAAERRVIDISGDGPSNAGTSVIRARDKIISKGITINGLPILSASDTSTLPFYEDCVIGGEGSFVLPISDMEQFSNGLRAKLILEIAAIPAIPVQRPTLIATKYNCD